MNANKVSLMDMRTKLKVATDELIQVQQELETEKVAGEGRKKKFVMLQTTFSKREDALNAELSSLQEQLNEMHHQHDTQVCISDSDVRELTELRVMAIKMPKLEERCVHLETALSSTQNVGDAYVGVYFFGRGGSIQ